MSMVELLIGDDRSNGGEKLKPKIDQATEVIVSLLGDDACIELARGASSEHLHEAMGARVDSIVEIARDVTSTLVYNALAKIYGIED